MRTIKTKNVPRGESLGDSKKPTLGLASSTAASKGLKGFAAGQFQFKKSQSIAQLSPFPPAGGSAHYEIKNPGISNGDHPQSKRTSTLTGTEQHLLSKHLQSAQ